jgi:hypothetical protein
MENPKHPAVYMLASRFRGTLYVGVTSELYNRIHHHTNEVNDGFKKNIRSEPLFGIPIFIQWTKPSGWRSKSSHGNVNGNSNWLNSKTQIALICTNRSTQIACILPQSGDPAFAGVTE